MLIRLGTHFWYKTVFAGSWEMNPVKASVRRIVPRTLHRIVSTREAAYYTLKVFKVNHLALVERSDGACD